MVDPLFVQFIFVQPDEIFAYFCTWTKTGLDEKFWAKTGWTKTGRTMGNT